MPYDEGESSSSESTTPEEVILFFLFEMLELVMLCFRELHAIFVIHAEIETIGN